MRYSREEGRKTWVKRKKAVSLRLNKIKERSIQLRIGISKRRIQRD